MQIIGLGINSEQGTIRIRDSGGSTSIQVFVTIERAPQFVDLYGLPLPDSYLT